MCASIANSLSVRTVDRSCVSNSPRTVREVRDVLIKEYNVESDRCERDLVALLQQLVEHDLVDIVHDV